MGKRARETYYRDYGMSGCDVERVKLFCIRSTKEEQEGIKKALSGLPPYVAPIVFMSLIQGISYDKISDIMPVFIGRGDFYGYQRKGVHSIKVFFEKNGVIL